MLRALNSALHIYFLRRVRDVDSTSLQIHVDEVIIALQQFNESMQKAGLHGPGTAWPAFMAGCEASLGFRRQYLLEWINGAFRKTGNRTYDKSKRIMLEVWRKRDELDFTGHHTKVASILSWVDVCREQGEWVIFC